MAAGTFVVAKTSVGQPVGVVTAAPAYAATAPPPGSTPQWDAARGAYVQWDPAAGRYVAWDDTTKTWN